jgi:hypothetical protein
MRSRDYVHDTPACCQGTHTLQQREHSTAPVQTARTNWGSVFWCRGFITRANAWGSACCGPPSTEHVPVRSQGVIVLQDSARRHVATRGVPRAATPLQSRRVAGSFPCVRSRQLSVKGPQVRFGPTPWSCNGSSISLGSSTWSGFLDWCVSGMSPQSP